MSLRVRLAVLLAAVIPFAVLLAILQTLLIRRNVAITTGEAIAARFDGPQHARCEAKPALWPHVDRPPNELRRHRRRFAERRSAASYFAYDEAFLPARRDAPALPPRVRGSLARGDDIAWSDLRSDEPGETLLVVAHIADDGPCAYVATVQSTDAQPLWFTLVPVLAVSGFAVLLAVFAAGPLVRRVRRLTTAVRRARAGESISIPIEGGDELTELARAIATDRTELAAKVEALRRRDEALTRFVTNTTHDVMIPLTVLQNHLLALRRPEDEADLAAQALAEAHYLGSLLQNLSAAAKLDAVDRTIERVEVDLADLVARVAQRHRTLAQQKQIELDFAAPERLLVQADMTLVERALSNIVHNAVRYGQPGGHIAIVLEPVANGFHLEVLDDGLGVGPADLSRLGERRFRSEEARSRHPGGTGHGLAITREIAERHGWELSFAQNEPHGLRVVLEGSPSH